MVIILPPLHKQSLYMRRVGKSYFTKLLLLRHSTRTRN